MSRLALLAVLGAVSAFSADLSALLRSIEARYNNAKTLQVSFQESYRVPGRPVRTESGTLYLRKPGRMRWEYTVPANKLFLSDGQDLYLYTPSNNQVEKMKVKESEDLRAPLAFLLGRLSFQKEFRRIEARSEDSGTWLMLEPKSDNFPYHKVEFFVGPDSEIRRVKIFGYDRSVLEFFFNNEKRNPKLEPKLFVFNAPPNSKEALPSSQ